MISISLMFWTLMKVILQSWGSQTHFTKINGNGPSIDKFYSFPNSTTEILFSYWMWNGGKSIEYCIIWFCSGFDKEVCLILTWNLRKSQTLVSSSDSYKHMHPFSFIDLLNTSSEKRNVHFGKVQTRNGYHTRLFEETFYAINETSFSFFFVDWNRLWLENSAARNLEKIIYLITTFGQDLLKNSILIWLELDWKWRKL